MTSGVSEEHPGCPTQDKERGLGAWTRRESESTETKDWRYEEKDRFKMNREF